jgi:hypothetical protein
MGQQVIDTIWGSTAAGADITDPGDIKMNLGWLEEIPPHEYENFWHNRVDQALEYSQQSGVEAWHSLVIYRDDGLSMGSDGIVYQSQQAANLNHNPVGDNGTWWLPFASINGVKVTVVTASDPVWAPTAGAKSLKVFVTGGGGGGGGLDYVSTGPAASAAGSGGGTAIKYVQGPLSATYAIVVGAAGSGGVAANGGDGGDSSFDVTVVGSGGNGGNKSTSAIPGLSSNEGNAGGATSGGDLNLTGCDSSARRTNSSAEITAMSQSGASYYGGSRTSEVAGQDGKDANATTWGAGGGACSDVSLTSDATGGDGAPGAVIIEEHF